MTQKNPFASNLSKPRKSNYLARSMQAYNTPAQHQFQQSAESCQHLIKKLSWIYMDITKPAQRCICLKQSRASIQLPGTACNQLPGYVQLPGSDPLNDFSSWYQPEPFILMGNWPAFSIVSLWWRRPSQASGSACHSLSTRSACS